jgi:hypothetical protein
MHRRPAVPVFREEAAEASRMFDTLVLENENFHLTAAPLDLPASDKAKAAPVWQAGGSGKLMPCG